jgi:hypothetical protein
MSTLEIYFLALVCGAFGACALSLATGQVRYKSWARAARSRGSRH